MIHFNMRHFSETQIQLEGTTESLQSIFPVLLKTKLKLREEK